MLTWRLTARPTATGEKHRTSINYLQRPRVAANVRRQEEIKVTESSLQRYYSPWQICVAAIIGSPLASGYLASRNYALFKAPSKATAALLVSVGVFIALLAVGYSLPKGTSGTILAGVVAGAYKWHAQVAFAPEIARLRTEGWSSHSWWRVIGLSLAILVAIAVLGFVILLLLGDHAA